MDGDKTAIKIYVPGDEGDALAKISEALNKSGVKYDTLTTVTAEAFLSKAKNHPDDIELSPKVMQSLLKVGKYDGRVKAMLKDRAASIEKALQEQMNFVKSLK